MNILEILTKTKTGIATIILVVAYSFGYVFPSPDAVTGVAMWATEPTWIISSSKWLFTAGMGLFGVGVRDALQKIIQA